VVRDVDENSHAEKSGVAVEMYIALLNGRAPRADLDMNEQLRLLRRPCKVTFAEVRSLLAHVLGY